jgi:prefoldin subunit 5
MAMPHLEFDQMTAEQKFKFLEKYCDNLARSLQEAQGNIQRLHERLRQVEGRESGEEGS